MSAKVVVSGKSPVWRRGMAALLEDQDFEVEVSDGLSTWLPHQDGSCVVVGLDDAEAGDPLRAFREDHPFTPVVAVTDDLDISTFARAIRGGATAVVTESDGAEVLCQVIMAALEGRASVASGLVAQLAELVPDDEDIQSWVSEEEMRWLQAMADGLTVLELADDVGYSERAMFRHLKDLYMRIGVKNRTEALLWASRHGILKSDG